MIGIEKKDPQQMTTFRDELRHLRDVVGTTSHRNGTEAGMLKDKLVGALPFKKISDAPREPFAGIPGLRLINRLLRQIQPDEPAFGSCMNEMSIMAKSTARNKNCLLYTSDAADE